MAENSFVCCLWLVKTLSSRGARGERRIDSSLIKQLSSFSFIQTANPSSPFLWSLHLFFHCSALLRLSILLFNAAFSSPFVTRHANRPWGNVKRRPMLRCSCGAINHTLNYFKQVSCRDPLCFHIFCVLVSKESLNQCKTPSLDEWLFQRAIYLSFK